TGHRPHPNYDFANAASAYDFCIVTFDGALASTPVVPAMSPAEDALVAGDVVDLVGFGATTPGATAPNTVRRHIELPIYQIAKLQPDYDVTGGGTCEGDSGGPALVVVADGLRVAGVTSFGEQGCTGFGVSGRVSSVYDDFIQPSLGGEAAPATCDQCAAAA